MARLPDVETLGSRPIPQRRATIASVRNAGAIGEAIGEVGEVVGRIAEQKLRQVDDLQLRKADSEFLKRKVELDAQFENDQDFATKQTRYTDALRKARDESASIISANGLRQSFISTSDADLARGADRMRVSVLNSVRDVGRADTTKGLRDDIEAAVSAPDPKDAERLLQNANGRLTAARNAGWISAQEEVEMRQRLTENYGTDRLSLFSNEKQVELLGKSLKAEKTNSFLDYIPLAKRKALWDDAQARVRAEQRYQRQELRLATQARLETGREIGRMLSDHIPVPVQSIDAAIADARAAGDNALAYRLTMGRVETKLAMEYKSATPTEIQDDLNKLDADITKAGSNAKPELIVARDYLITMRDKASAALEADPLSWSAGARGVSIPPLDWDNPKSLQQRMKVAHLVTSNTGAGLSPLTDEEMDTLRVDMRKGPGGQVNVIERIRRLGPEGAVAVARKLAPENDAFRVATGLATTLASPMSRQTAVDALTGGDVLKATPHLFDDQQAQRWFGDMALPAMRMLPPEMRAGVFSAAKNIYAAMMSRQGEDRWTPKMWPTAVSLALGGSPTGKGGWKGGLATWKEEPLVLPSGMTEREFGLALSRADDASLAKAGNGAPVWANGASVKTRQFRQLRLVAVGDGIYQLGDGNGFLSVKGGGAYRLDVRKLNRIAPPAPVRGPFEPTVYPSMRNAK